MTAHEDSEMDPMIGRTVGGRYTLLSVLGHGGEGVVYLAEQEGLGREVVVKLMRADLGLDPSALKRFDRESRLVASIHHPHIVGVYDFGRDDDGLAWIVMERLTGETLKDRLARGPVPLKLAIAIARQVGLALGAAHERGIIHRDVKPANIWLLDAPGGLPLVKVLDFGIARQVTDRSQTQSGVMGTEGYIAPERLLGEAPTTRSDGFSLGVVFYELITGRNPFLAATSHETQTRILQHQPPPPGAGDVVDGIVARLLKKDPTQRLDVLGLVALVDGLSTDTVEVAGTTRRIAPPTEPTSSASSSSWQQRRGVLAVVTAAAIASMVALVMWPGVGSAMGRATLADKPSVERKPLRELSPPPSLDDEARRRVELGRLLFHDPALSKPAAEGQRRVSCASCHPISTDGYGTTREGFTVLGHTGERMRWNTPSVMNAAVSYRQAWKGDALTVEDVIQRPLTGRDLMGKQELDEIPPRLSHWSTEFAAAGLPLTVPGMLRALGDYVRFLEPTGSPFDAALKGEHPLSDDASRGQALFERFGCIGCHQGEGVGANLRVPFGVIEKNPYKDRGHCSGNPTIFCRSDAGCVDAGACIERGMTEVREQDQGPFRVPSLRNVAMTAPYFHDGSAATLDEAVRVMARVQLGRELRDDDVAVLVAFLETLTAPLSQVELDAVNAASRRVLEVSPAAREAR